MPKGSVQLDIARGEVYPCGVTRVPIFAALALAACGDTAPPGFSRRALASTETCYGVNARRRRARGGSCRIGLASGGPLRGRTAIVAVGLVSMYDSAETR